MSKKVEKMSGDWSGRDGVTKSALVLELKSPILVHLGFTLFLQ